MPRTKRPRVFTEGDVIKYDESHVTPEELIRFKAKPNDTGVITRIDKWANGYTYYIEWFQQREDTLCTNSYRLKLCEGMKNPDLCDKCKYRFECWTSRRIDC